MSASLDILNQPLGKLIALPDEEAAIELDRRMDAWEQVETLHERSYAERGQIVLEFERRKLWKHLLNPNSQEPFNSFSAWMAMSSLGGRRVNFESARDMKELQDVPIEKLKDVPKSNIKVLKQLSTAVRNDESVLQAAKTLPQNQFLQKIENEHPNQHVEGPKLLRFSPGSSAAKAVEEAIAWALEHDIAVTRDDALVKGMETALHVWQLDAEIADIAQKEKEGR